MSVVDENLILEESAEVAAASVPWTQKILTVFPAFSSRNYQLYFFGQLVSMIGTWLQIVAEGWLVFQLTHSALYVGLDAAAAMIPSLFLSLFGGVIVDKFPKRTILFITQTAAMILALILGVMTITGTVTVWWIIFLAFLLGIVSAVNTPALQSYVVELVEDKSHLASAIALGAGMFNAARAIGPTVAGLLIAVYGTGVAFILNGVSYLAIIVALYFIRTQPIRHGVAENPLAAIREGLAYTFSHETIRLLLVLTGIISIFGWSYSTLMPVIATTIFHSGADTLGYLYATTGLGAFTGAMVVSAYAKRISAERFILGGLTLFALSLFTFTFVTSLPVAYLVLFVVGFGLVMLFSTTNSSIQHAVEDHMRGRVMSIYALVFMGLAPIGNVEIGAAAERVGSEMAIRLSVVVVALFAMYLYPRRHKLVMRHLA